MSSVLTKKTKWKRTYEAILRSQEEEEVSRPAGQAAAGSAVTQQAQQDTMIPEVDIFVGNYTIIDPEVFELWVQGYSVLQQRGELEAWGGAQELLASDTADHYRAYGMLEKLLLTPPKLGEEWTFQLEPAVQRLVVEKFYELDDIVIREIIGKKLSGRTRKDLDDVAEKTGSVAAVLRQFDNVKRIFKHVDEMTGSVVANIQTAFLLPLNLAKKYASIVFIINNRFETSKRKLNYLTFEDFSVCASLMMSSWTTASPLAPPLAPDTRDDTDFDRDFLIELRDFKLLLDREKEHRNVTLSHLRGKIPDRMCSEVESNFKTYSRGIINIGCSLNNSRDLRDFFVDAVERVVEPCRQARWRSPELEIFLRVYAEAGSALDIMTSDRTLRTTWERYMTTMRVCLAQLYHS
ncbi:Acidic fibroblast growth factor intracellular-binding protein [Chionoecetes opilio]|uniref:Acidic fibroblast growth factor intracellular-binding protein n=1 Tax=Chionoecetes opilio TaxID=41210 RepID=A0A8J5CDC9_CHIOP|nr:Acidic fibroblast growth factor intracellular-binding protein [Chionoecetes opilio]